MDTRVTGWHSWRWGLWLRVRGYGVHLEVDRRALFSEREGFRRVRRVGRVALEFLEP